MNLVTSCLMILARVFVYNPEVLQKQENIDQKKKANVVSLNSFNSGVNTKDRHKGKKS